MAIKNGTPGEEESGERRVARTEEAVEGKANARGELTSGEKVRIFPEAVKREEGHRIFREKGTSKREQYLKAPSKDTEPVANRSLPQV